MFVARATDGGGGQARVCALKELRLLRVRFASVRLLCQQDEAKRVLHACVASKFLLRDGIRAYRSKDYRLRVVRSGKESQPPLVVLVGTCQVAGLMQDLREADVGDREVWRGRYRSLDELQLDLDVSGYLTAFCRSEVSGLS